MADSTVLWRKIDHIRAKPEMKEVLWAMVEEIERSRDQAVTKTDFSDLKAIVGDLAAAQQRTEQRVGELTEAQKELTQAQQRTEQRVEELTEAQKELTQAQQRTEQRVEDLTEAQQRTEQRMEQLAETQQETSREVAHLTRTLDATNSHVGGLARSVAYALENEAYRKLPAYLAARHQLEVQERFIRTEIADVEVNFFATARRPNGEEVLIVGESVLKLDDRGKFAQLDDAVEAARQTTAQPIVPMLVTHYARPNLLASAQQHGIIVVQSFEWAL